MKAKWKERPQFKFQILSSLSICLAVLLLATAIAVSLLVRTEITRQSMRTAQNNLGQLKNSLQQVLEVMDGSMTQLALDRDIQGFADRMKILDIFDREDVFSRLYQFRAANKYLGKLYVYYDRQDILLDMNGVDARVLPMDGVADAQIIRNAVERTRENRFQKLYTIFNVAEENADPILVVTKPAPPMARSFNTAIVVQLDANYFARLLNSIVFNEHDNLFVLDENGNFLFGKRVNAPDQKMVSITLAWEDTGWEFVYQFSQKQIQNQVGAIIIWVWMITILALICSAFAVLYLTNAFYSPVRAMVQAVSDEEEAAPPDEIRFVNDRIDRLRQENKRTKQLLKDNLPFFRETVQYRLLNNSSNDDDTLQEHMRRCEMKFIPNAFYGVAILSLQMNGTLEDHLPNGMSDQLTLLEVGAIQTVMADFEHCAVEFICNPQTVKSVLLFSIAAQSADDADSTLKQILEAVFLTAGELCSEVSVGAGRVYSGLSDVHKSFYEAGLAYSYGAVAGFDHVIYHDALPKTKFDSFEYPCAIEQKLFDAIRRSDSALLHTHAQLFFDEIRKRMPQDYHPTLVGVQLLSSTLQLLQQLSLPITVIGEDAEQPIHKVVAFQTMEEIQTFFMQVFARVSEELGRKKQTHKSDVCSQVVELVDSHYQDERLGLEYLAEKMYFSVSYLVKVFKAETGMSIKEYITQRRIEVAKQILRDGDFRVSAVAKRVGYTNSRSFINIFKKYTGLTPGEYKTALPKRDS